MSETEDGDKDKDKDKRAGVAPDSAKPGTVVQAAGASSGAVAPDYQFFVDGSAGYNFGLGQSGFSSTPQFDTSLPDWFKNAATGVANTASPVFKPPSAPVSAPVPISTPTSISTPASISAPALSSIFTPVLPTAGPTFPSSLPLPQLAPIKALGPLPALPPEVPIIASAQPPLAAVRRVEGGVRPVPLNLHVDERFSKLTLPAELSQTVDRIFSLNDLDFNGFVDFNEITKMLEGDELTTSEKPFVQLIYQVGKKIVAERPVYDPTVVPVMSKEDFRLAFASVVKGAFEGLATATSEQTERASRLFRPTVYAEEDYPLGSIKAQAVKLGTVGDAYFAACLVSMIDLQPRSIMRMINTSNDQSFIITFPGLHGKGLVLMPPRAEEIMHYGLAQTYGYWYPLLEKAFGMYVAQHHKLANALEHGNDTFHRTAQAVEALTGAQTGRLIVSDFEPDQIRVRILEILSKGKIVVAISADGISQGATVAGIAPLPLKPYAVQGYDQNRAKMIVRGAGTVNTSNLDESVLHLATEQFAHYFKVVYFERDLDHTGPADTDAIGQQLAKPRNNHWHKLPDE